MNFTKKFVIFRTLNKNFKDFSKKNVFEKTSRKIYDNFSKNYFIFENLKLEKMGCVKKLS